MNALQEKAAQDALGYAGVWLVGPLASFWYVNQVKRTRKKRGAPLSAWQMRGLASLMAFVAAMFFGNRMAGWPLDKALNHGVAVAFTFPLLVAVLLDKIKRVAPDVAQDIGDLPTEFRAADTADLTQCNRDPEAR